MTFALELEALEQQLGARIDVRRPEFEVHRQSAGEVLSEQQVVAVVGLGSMGLPTAIALRGAGAQIVGIDSCRQRLRAITSGDVELPSPEAQELQRYLLEGGFALTSHSHAMAAADLVLICVPEPKGCERRAGLHQLQQACASVVANARPGQTVVLGTVACAARARELLVRPLCEKGLHVGVDLMVAFVPEHPRSHARPAPPRMRVWQRRR